MRSVISTLVFYLIYSSLWCQIPALQSASDKAEEFLQGSSKQILYPNNFVNPFIGTGGHGHTFPGATAPFGMIQLSPDTRYDGWDGCSGYHYSDSIVYGFSHTHLSGTGVSDYGDLLVLPQVGKPKKVPKYMDQKEGFGEYFKHDKELARPGYYTVVLEQSKIKVRLTAGKRSGMHEYTFPKEKNIKTIILDLSHRDKVKGASLSKLGDSVVEGYRISSAWADEQHFYFSIKLNTPIKKIKKLKGNRYILFLDNYIEKVYMHVGISATSIDGARKNRQSEDNPQARDFASKFTYLLGQTMLSWDKHLSKIRITTKDKNVLTNFYTALYHSQIAPNLFSDIDGAYRGMDQKIHFIPKAEEHFTVFSLWDTYRATHPLLALIDTGRTASFLRTFLRQHEQMGDLPVWELSGNETECMIGYHSVSVIADAYLKGIKGFDAKKALAAMVSASLQKEFGRNTFHEIGFLASDTEPESVSKTLEYAYDDFCIAQMAKAMDSTQLSETYSRASYNFLNVLDPKSKFMRARKGAQWYGPFIPEEVNFNYTEANAWQYSLYAPQHIETLLNFLGGKDSLERWLDRLFESTIEPSGRVQADITGLIGQYAHGNEPSHHMAYLYNYTNASHKTQKYLNRILRELYKPQPDGLSGNEDCGQMSSWYVFSALGFYPVCPGKPVYHLGRPLIDYASIPLENGNKFEIIVKNNDSENFYIKNAKLNGRLLNAPMITHEDILQGAILEIEMTSIPTDWNPIVETSKIPSQFVFTPFIVNEKRIFSDSLLIEIRSIDPDQSTEHFFSIDHHEYSKYENPFYIYKSSNIQIKSKKKHKGMEFFSSPIESSFILSDSNKSLELNTNFANQYAASGKNTLIDGEFGSKDYRTGEWQGFYGKDVQAIVHFNTPTGFQKIGVSYLTDIKSWIFPPKEIRIYGSVNKVDYNLIAKTKIKKSKYTDNNNEMKKIVFHVRENKAYHNIKFEIRNYGKCPAWHLGAGEDSWLFLDELIFE